MSTEGLAALAQRLPKAELHFHLEGAMPHATLLALARRHGVALPADDVPGLERWFRFRDFPHFLEIYLTLSSCLRTPEDIYRLALDVLAEQARQRIVYTEAHFTISTHLANGLDGAAVLDALVAAAAEGEAEHGVVLRLIPDIVRNLEVERADATIEWAIAGQQKGLVVALGLAGLEKGHTSAPFRRHFEAAEAAGLRRVAHTGEQTGPEAIRETLEATGAERIGHGVRAIDDPTLVRQLAASGIPFEICPTSNVRLGYFSSLAEHPFDRLRRAGCEVTLNSDDPPLFGTTLVDEYCRVATTFGYGREDLVELAGASFRHSFLDAASKGRWIAEVERVGAEGDWSSE